MTHFYSRSIRLASIAAALLTACASHATAAVAAVLDTSRPDYQFECPYLIRFDGHITGDPGSTVRYRFLRSDDALAPEQEAVIPKTGRLDVSTTWTLGTSYDGWQAIEVLAPEHTVSEKAFFQLRCRPDPYANTSGQVKVSVDPNVIPAIEKMPRTDGTDAPVAAIVDSSGLPAEFVENELLILSDNRSAVDDFVRRWAGTILHDYGDPVVWGMARMYHVRIDPSSADESALSTDVKRLEPLSSGEYRVSNLRGLKLLAAAAREALTMKVSVTVNWILRPASFATRTTTEASSGPDGYTSDAYRWPYMTRGPGSVQNIGVAEAWTLLDSDGRLSDPRKIQIGILDAGFTTPAINGDYPGTPRLFGSFGTPNPWRTGSGGFSRWHGTSVTNAAMGVPDNGFGAAGPAGPVASATLIESPAPDLASILRYLTVTLPAALASGPRILNMSASVGVPGGFAFLGEAMNQFTRGLRRMGILIFASAGNAGQDVDARDLSWEHTWFMPCENDGVICVGSLAPDSLMRDPGSNFGTSRDQLTTVRIFGPDCVFVGPNEESAPGAARQACGTSIASPFVAGVAALIWSANREMSANDVERLLLGFAQHTSPDPTVSAIVDAFAAVTAALPVSSGVPPASVSCASPQHFRVTLNGFRVNRETDDDVLERDGAGDEVFVVAESVLLDSSGATLRRSPRSVVMGDLNRVDGEPRIQAGTRGAAGLGGLRTGDAFPSSDPSSRSSTAPLFSDRPAMNLFDGAIAAGDVLLLFPTLWEYDPRGALGFGGSDGRDVAADWSEPVLRASDAMAAFARAYLSAPPPGNPLFSGSAAGLVGLGRSDFGESPHNRPIGLRAVGDRLRFEPTGVALGCPAALEAARANAGFGAGVLPITYSDQPDRGLNGNYTLFLHIEWLPF